ncbi:hypothetical protein MSG28_002097 [Choristoneura fumiferana]|uniref:Uncharacterized protein n=1 Tax=Choristoneura fumiferana TaxID=7141 RepID=A0ACC0JU05_CHOFU|nr:hypothetical protein MSG28_002097 [Choristoneura fumiferana]
MDPGILCFHHCDHKVFCTIIPEQCPVCDQKLDRYDYNLLPFRVPYPFVKASQHPRAIVMKPTHGDFLNPLWEADRYNEERHNCFTFVLAFLRTLDCGELSEKARDPKLFCKQYVVPRTSAAGKYISLYRQLKRQDYFIQSQ